MTGKAEIGIQNLGRALAKLEQFLLTEKPTEIERAGIIQAFEFCFETFWKAFKKLGEEQGLIAGSPKLAVKAAFHMGLFDEEAIWLNMLTDRNLSSHTYNESVAQTIYEHVRDSYAHAFKECFAKLKALPSG